MPSSNDVQQTYIKIVDAMNQLFGVHSGYRPVHAKGIVCEGTLYPAPTAASLTRAPHFQRDPVKATVRFSDFAGVPQIPDTDPNASPRGMAIKFHLPGSAVTDIVAHSFNGFPVPNAEEFLGFIRALIASGPDAPKPTPIEQFLATRPQALRFATTPKPTPASFATESYYGVDAFRLINASGSVRCALPDTSVGGRTAFDFRRGGGIPSRLSGRRTGEAVGKGTGFIRDRRPAC